MQSWQIKALELEASGLKHLDGFIHEHDLGFFIGVIYLLLALLVWILSGALRGKAETFAPLVRPGLFIHLPGPKPPPRDTFDPRPQHSAQCDHDEDWG